MCAAELKMAKPPDRKKHETTLADITLQIDAKQREMVSMGQMVSMGHMASN